MAQQIYKAEKIASIGSSIFIGNKKKLQQKIPDFRGEIQKVKSQKTTVWITDYGNMVPDMI